MSAIDQVRLRVTEEFDPLRRIEVLVLALADAIKSASNDQNVQRLSRELRATATDLAAAVAAPIKA